jgi:pimeloyl-ACP methyl ester carboxylesterase
VPASALPELRALLPGARFAAVDHAAHMIPWDNLDEFVAVILQFTGEQCQHPATTQPPRD